MVNRVVPEGQLMDDALYLAGKLAALPKAAMAQTKRLFYEVLDLPLEESLKRAREVNRKMRGFGKS